MPNTIHSSQSSLQDVEKKLEIEHQPRKKRWLLIIAIIVLVVIVIIAIAVPVSIHRQSSSSAISTTASSTAATDTQHEETLQQSSSSSLASSSVSMTTTTTKTTGLHQQVNTNKKITAASIITMDQSSLHPPEYAHDVSPYANLTRVNVYTPADDARVFVMGDVHGCLDDMNKLLNLIQFDQQKDVLILTGDLVFRGPDSLGVIRRAKELNALCVRGNHDDKVIRLRGYENKFGSEAMTPKDEIMPEGDVGDPLKFGNKHVAIAREMSVEDYNYLVACPLILDIPSLNARVVHGGIDPYISLVNQDPWSVMNMRDMDEKNHPTKAKLSKNSPSSSNIHWTTAYNEYVTNNLTVYYGHDASRGINLASRTIGVDSGCIYGRKLSAIEMRSDKLFQVDCQGEKGKADDDDD